SKSISGTVHPPSPVHPLASEVRLWNSPIPSLEQSVHAPGASGGPSLEQSNAPRRSVSGTVHALGGPSLEQSTPSEVRLWNSPRPRRSVSGTVHALGGPSLEQSTPSEVHLW
ncbi:unnamed protein product, partial [Staurois parvus]